MNKILLIGLCLMFGEVGCTQTVKQKTTSQKDSIYQFKSPSRDGTGKFYLGREISYVMDAAGASWLERNDRNEEENTSLANSTPARIPSSFTKSLAFPVASFGIQAKELWSPSPTSSRMALAIIPFISSLNCAFEIIFFY